MNPTLKSNIWQAAEMTTSNASLCNAIIPADSYLAAMVSPACPIKLINPVETRYTISGLN